MRTSFSSIHTEERQPSESTVNDSASVLVGIPYDDRNIPSMIHSLYVRDLAAGQRFYESLDLFVAREGGIAWVYPPSNVGNTRFLFQLRQGSGECVAITSARSEQSLNVLRALGLKRVVQSEETWRWGREPDGRAIELIVSTHQRKNTRTERTFSNCEFLLLLRRTRAITYLAIVERKSSHTRSVNIRTLSEGCLSY